MTEMTHFETCLTTTTALTFLFLHQYDNSTANCLLNHLLASYSLALVFQLQPLMPRTIPEVCAGNVQTGLFKESL